LLFSTKKNEQKGITNAFFFSFISKMSSRVSLPEKIIVEYNCYKCECNLCDGTRLREHLNREHKVLAPPPLSGKRRRSNKEYQYVKDGDDPTAIVHNACPSCLKHYFDMNDLINHLNQQHLVKEHIEDCAIIQRKTNSYCFVPALKLNNNHISSVPKLSLTTIQELKNIVKIIAPYNQQLSPSDMNSLKGQQDDQDKLIALKQFPSVHSSLLGVLAIDNYKEWPKYMWNFVGDAKSDLEIKLLEASKYILTDYANKCNREPIFTPKHEKTLWIDRVIPILQTIGDQTGYIGFEWCEVEPTHYKAFTMDLLTFKRTSKRNADGIGFNKYKNDIMILEGSSPLNKDDTEHEVDDTLKNIHSSICMLDCIIRENLNINFSTVTEVKVISIQTSGKYMTLSTTYLDLEKPGKFVHIQNRHAAIPMSLNDKYEWVVLFELISYLTILLDEQDKTRNVMIKERNKILFVNPNQTVSKAMKIT
jgi:hypothetical protein